VLLTLAFIRFVRCESWLSWSSYLLVAGLLTGICLLLIRFAATQFEVLPFHVKSIRTADKEILAFVLAYLLPFASSSAQVRPVVLVFVFALLFAVVWTTHSYHCNPLLGFCGYHFYEVTTDSSVTFILLTRRTLRDCSAVARVAQLTDYVVLDIENTKLPR